MTSRNTREGRYVGRWRYKHMRRKKEVPAWVCGNTVMLPATPPFVDASLAWTTFAERNKEKAMERLRSPYLEKKHQNN